MDTLLATLCRASAECGRPAPLDWPARLEPELWFFSPELVSMSGTDAWRRLPQEERRRASLFEAAAFFSLNVHGERRLIEGLAARLHRPRTATVTPYLHHFLAEENDHMALFGEFCVRYAGGVYADRAVAFPRDWEPGEEDVVFFARVLVFEEMVDRYNVAMAADQRLHPLVRAIHDRHHRDESRHLAFGRRQVADLAADHLDHWSNDTRAGVREHLWEHVAGTLRALSSPDAYRDAGFDDPHALRDEALALPAARARHRWLAGPCLRFLARHGLVDEGRDVA